MKNELTSMKFRTKEAAEVWIRDNGFSGAAWAHGGGNSWIVVQLARCDQSGQNVMWAFASASQAIRLDDW